MCFERERTVCSGVEDDEARIHRRALAIVCPRHSVCMTTKTFLFLEKVHFMLGIAKCVESAEARYATADDGYALLLHVSGHDQLARNYGEDTNSQVHGWS